MQEIWRRETPQDVVTDECGWGRRAVNDSFSENDSVPLVRGFVRLLAFVCFTLNNEHHSLRIKKNMSYVITLATSHFLWI